MAGRAKASITTSWMNETAPGDMKPKVLWGDAAYAQASDLVFDTEELGGDQATSRMGKHDPRKW